MKRIIILICASLFFWSAASAQPEIIDGGIAKADPGQKNILEGKTVWDASESDDWMVAWIKISPGSDLKYGNPFYRYKVRFACPDNSLIFLEGPFTFDKDGYGKVLKQLWALMAARTSEYPKPCLGLWSVGFYICDPQTNVCYLAKEISFELKDAGIATARTSAETVSVPLPKATEETTVSAEAKRLVRTVTKSSAILRKAIKKGTR